MKMWIIKWDTNSDVRITKRFFTCSPIYLASTMVNHTEHTPCPLEFDGFGLPSKSSQPWQSSGPKVPSTMDLCWHKRGPSAYKYINKNRGTNVKLEHSFPLQCSHGPGSVSSVHSLGGIHKKPWNSIFSYLCHTIPPGHYPPFRYTTNYFTLFWKQEREFSVRTNLLFHDRLKRSPSLSLSFHNHHLLPDLPWESVKHFYFLLMDETKLKVVFYFTFLLQILKSAQHRNCHSLSSCD